MSSKLNRQRRILLLLIVVSETGQVPGSAREHRPKGGPPSRATLRRDRSLAFASRSCGFRFFRAGFRLSIMTSAADGVEKACLLAFGDRAEIEEDSPALNAGNHWRVANPQGAGPRPFRVRSGREWWADAHGRCRNGLHRHAPSPDERLGSNDRGVQAQLVSEHVHQPPG